MVLKQLPVVVLLDIYPKRGPSQQLDINDEEIQRLVEEFYSELDASKLVAHDINDHLKQIIHHEGINNDHELHEFYE